ncbi:TraX protein [Marinospirillum celere]|uniref:TraX protein n=1 Tax=Marinospirillum celere TaxID=1122252 RepID=A0A1I1H602_9GAMM|nr:TraX family protein [Marinospirillum celere]SFC19002.1 TraX protein [Marinospirillum celere]
MTINNQWISLAQWLAVISMTADHAARYLIPGLTDFYWLAATLGRLAFPFFAALVAWHALFNSRHLGRYTLRILIIGILAQPGYAWMLQEPLNQALLNVCFTLAAGLILTWGWLAAWKMHQLDGRFLYSWSFLGGLLLALLAAWLLDAWVDYGLVGILLVPALAISFHAYQQRQQPWGQQLGAWALWLLPGFLVLGLNPAGLPTFSSYFALLLLLLLILINRYWRCWQLPFPRWLWLSWYPLHLLVIAGAARWLA